MQKKSLCIQEVMDRAYDIFRRAYELQPITGNKARALILEQDTCSL